VLYVLQDLDRKSSNAGPEQVQAEDFAEVLQWVRDRIDAHLDEGEQ
jgi:hypothetical protein